MEPVHNCENIPSREHKTDAKPLNHALTSTNRDTYGKVLEGQSFPTSVREIDLTSSQMAFRGKDDKEVRSAYRLFKLLNTPVLSTVGPKVLEFALRMRLPIEGLIRTTIFKHFVGGTTLEETREASKRLEKDGIQTILDYSVEGESSEAGLDKTKSKLSDTIQHAAISREVSFVAIKATGLISSSLLEKWQGRNELSDVENTQLDNALARFESLCGLAKSMNVKVFIDAEESWIQDGIDRITELMMKKYNKDETIVFNTAQMYRNDRLPYLEKLYELAKEDGFKVGIKLVRGAYMEKEASRAQQRNTLSPINGSKDATDQCYNEAVQYCISQIDHGEVCIATHNLESVQKAISFMGRLGLEPRDERVSFAQLFGMSDNLSNGLASAEYNTGKYLPYGPVREVMPYLMRRAAENSSISGQSSREFELVRKELERRGI